MMKIRVLRAPEIRRLLPMPDCIDLMEQTMISVSRGQAVLPLRTLLRMPDHVGMLGNMQGYIAEPEAYGVKLVSLFPRNAGTGYSSHLGIVILFEVEHGCPTALLDAAEITAIRTAAASGMATRLLARPDANSLTILGAGEQAIRHLEAMLAVRPLTDIRVWARHRDKATAFAREQGARHRVTIKAFSSAEEAAREAQIICTVTHSPEPVLMGDWVAEGAHLNVVGSSLATAAEIDSPLVIKSRFFVDYRLSTVNEGGEYLRALKAGLIQENHILAEIGEVAAGSSAGRLSGKDITIYKSLGIAAQDVAASHYVLEKARAENIGQTVDF